MILFSMNDNENNKKKRGEGVTPEQKERYLQESKKVMEKYNSFIKDSNSLSKGIILLGIASLIAFIVIFIQNLS